MGFGRGGSRFRGSWVIDRWDYRRFWFGFVKKEVRLLGEVDGRSWWFEKKGTGVLIFLL